MPKQRPKGLFLQFVHSFGHAFRGLFWALGSQRNLRFHLAAAVWVCYLGFFARFSAGQWGLIALCCGSVLAAELGNTALEVLCDKVCPEHDSAIGRCKDVAAAAVLVAAIAAVAVGLLLFCQSGRPARLLAALRSPWPLPLTALLLLASWLLVRGGLNKK